MENNQSIEQQSFAIDESKFPLESERLLLKKWTIEDTNDLYEFMGQEEVMSPVGAPILKSIDQAENTVKAIMNWYEKTYKYELAIFSRSEKKVIGTIGIKLKNISKNIVEIGYLLNKDYWNQGIMTESMSMIINYIRSISKNVRIICECKIDNFASKKVVEKSHMKFINMVERDNHTYAVYEL